MITHPIEQTITTLNQNIDSWRWWLDFWTGLVVLGLVLEYGREVFHLIAHRPFDRQKAVVVFGGILITVGVAGELFVQYRSASDENQLRIANEKLVHSLQEATAQANEKAAYATAQAAKLGVSQQNLHDYVARQELSNQSAIVELKTSTTQLNKARTDALAAADSSQKVLSKITAALDSERDLREKFAKMVEPRQLTPSQNQELVSELKKFAGQEYTVTTFWELKEPMAFSDDLFKVLNLAGWHYDRKGSDGLLLGGKTGVQVWYHPEATKNTHAAALALASILKKQGFEVEMKQINSPGHPEEKVGIQVGTKN